MTSIRIAYAIVAMCMIYIAMNNEIKTNQALINLLLNLMTIIKFKFSNLSNKRKPNRNRCKHKSISGEKNVLESIFTIFEHKSNTCDKCP